MSLVYHYLGNTYPTYLRIEFNISNPPLRRSFRYEDQIVELLLQMNGTSNFVAQIVCENEIQDLGELANTVRHLTQSLYDIALPISGHVNHVQLHSIILHDGRLARINLDDFTQLIPKSLIAIGMDEVYKATGNAVVRQALHDIRLACTESHLRPTFAFRAVETIRESFKPKNDKASDKSWISMRNCLNIERSYLNRLTELAKENRHGVVKILDAKERQMSLEVAINVFHRFIVYLNSERKDLEERAFPRLRS